MANPIGHPPLTEIYAPLLAPVIAAVISGAVAGCQLSPITDATIMASASAVSYHVDTTHKRKQAIHCHHCLALLLPFYAGTAF